MEYQQPRAQSSPTVIDVARLAGVSVATVSRVLNKNPGVTEVTRSKVVNACELLGYVRNHHAASLRTGTSDTISIIVADLSQPWYSKLISALKYELQQFGYSVVIHDLKSPGFSPSDLSKLPSVASRITPQDTRGVILAVGAVIDSPQIVQSLYHLSQRLPLVVVGDPIKGAPWSTVIFLDRDATDRATAYLYAQGRTRVGFLGNSPNSYVAAERQRGYEDAARQAGRYSSDLVWSIEGHEFQHGYKAMQAQLDLGISFDAILAVNDELAIGAMRVLNENGLSVPDDVAVIGFGDSTIGPYLPVATLTSVTGSVDDAASCITHILKEMIDGVPSEYQPVIKYLERHLILRESTAPNIH